MLAHHIKDRAILNHLWQAMRLSVTWGGLYKDCERGISRGCPLSPLLGAFFLHELDRAMERSGLFYVRYMDDILVLAPTRWKLRWAVTQVNGALTALDLEKHPDKTFIGRIEKGFDFLGYHFDGTRLAVARATVERFVAHATRLYEQERRLPGGCAPFGEYVRQWVGWAKGGLDFHADADVRLQAMSATFPRKATVAPRARGAGCRLSRCFSAAPATDP
jgi:hypothetical protein